jgi:hypothetical protein
MMTMGQCVPLTCYVTWCCLYIRYKLKLVFFLVTRLLLLNQDLITDDIHVFKVRQSRTDNLIKLSWASCHLL